MLNIFYRDSHLQGRMSGPKKVIQNLFRSLEDTGVSFATNQEKYENNLFLHWDPYQINNYATLKNKDKLLVGPQVWPFAPEFQQLTEYGKIITPSQWVADLYTKFFNVRGTLNWPVAIYEPEIEEKEPEIDCLIYFKNRPRNHLMVVLSHLQERGLTFTLLEYGNYSQEQFKLALSSVRFCVIIDNTESQGIATQEMMAANKPLFVLDQPVWDHMGQEYAVSATSVPYWSNECGEKITRPEEIEDVFGRFYSNLDNYTPKDFVDRELSPQKTVQILLDHYAS
jgi:hypothetical protein